MRKLLPLSAVLLSTAAIAQPSVPPSGTKTGNPDAERVICRRQVDINSRLSARRVCMTEARWAEYRQATRQWSESVQSSRPD